MRQQHASRNYSFSALNVSTDRIPQQSDAFTLVAQPRSDLWRTTTSQDTLTAPILFTNLRFPFVSAEVSITAPWSLEWDQAGLVIFVGDPTASVVATQQQQHQQQRTSPSITAPTTITSTTTSITTITPAAAAIAAAPPAYTSELSTTPPTIKWAKVGLELIRDTPHVSAATATTPHGTDWSCSMLHPTAHHTQSSYHQQQQQQYGCEQLRVKLERVGQALWMSYELGNDNDDGRGGVVGVVAAARRRWCKVREVTGFFCGVEDKQVRVGVYASRPAGLHATSCVNADRDLVVEFENLVIF